ncbi:hypothetical protein [Nonomuraea sp. NPDC001831]|uniref:hypothetical protein n=1 Tax=Nonomuraea sp. NPDC001831 TaxID=3364340 RepID=UPI00367A695A
MGASALVLSVIAIGAAAARLEPPPGAAPVQGTPSPSPSSSQEAPEASASPLRVTVRPSSVRVGTHTVRVTVFCDGSGGEGVAVSEAFSDDLPAGQHLDRSLPSGARYADAVLDPELRPGVYRVLARCDPIMRMGAAELTVLPDGASSPPTSAGRARTATTRITLAPAGPDAWRTHPDATEDQFPPDTTLYQLQVTHELRVPAGDPDVALLREGAAAVDPTAFAASRLGAVNADHADLPTSFAMPSITVAPDGRQAVITLTGRAYRQSFSAEDFVGVRYTPPAADDRPPLADHEILISAAGSTLAGVHGPVIEQDRRSVRLHGDREIRAAFVPDDGTASVSEYVTGEAIIGQLLASTGTQQEDDEENEPEDVTEDGAHDPDSGPLNRIWTVVQWVSGLAAILLLLNAALRALGRSWWRRRRNLLPPALLAVTCLTVPSPAWLGGEEGWWAWVALALVTIGVPLLALRSAMRAVPGGGPLLVVAGSVLATLAGMILSLWAMLVVTGQTGALWWPMVAPAAAAVLSAVPRWRRAVPAAGLLSLAAGVILLVRAALLGFVIDPVVALVLPLLSLSVLALGWVAEAGRGWSPRVAVAWVCGVWVAFGGLAYVLLAGTLFSGGRDEPDWPLLPTMTAFVAFGALLLALAVLVVRTRRIGQGPQALASSVALHTAVLFVLLLHVQVWTTLEYFGVTFVLAWAGMAWLLPPPAAQSPYLGEPVTAEEHRLLVRDLIRRRHARAALTELLRRRPPDDVPPAEIEERRTALERAGDDNRRSIDSDHALTTLAGRTPWQNALAGLSAGLLLSLPFSTVRILASIDSGRAQDDQVLLAALSLLSLPVLCMIFGYFYPRVRGLTPLTKSMTLLVAALLIELPAYMQTLVVAAATPDLDQQGLPTPREAWIGVLVAMGNIAVVSIGLGLWWEWRLMWLAAEPWGRLRDVRRLRALAAPLAAIVIATATATATALVNNVIVPLPAGQTVPAGTSSSPKP